MNSSAYCIPALLYDDSLATALKQKPHRPNLTATAQSYLERLDADALDLVHHVIAVLHEPAYNQANADALRAEGPRIPLAGWSDNRDKSAAAALGRSAARGRELLQLLDPEVPISGVTDGTLRDEIATVAVPTTARERNMTGEDFAITAGWGHYGASAVVMPGRGRAIEREYTAAEHTKFGEAGAVLGRTTVDVYLNDNACWRNVPADVWRYKLGGHQVLKKWLSYRERGVLGRALTPHEVLELTKIARRISAILTMRLRAPEPDGITGS